MGATLKDRQWELDEKLMFGLGTDIMVENFSFSETDLDFEDRKLPNGDGEISGPEQYGGRTLTFDFLIYTGIEYDDGTWADRDMEKLLAAWRGCRGRTVIIRYNMMGRTRRVYGRCRKIAPPANGFDVRHGEARLTAEFRCHDGFSYSDILESTEIKMVPTDSTGFTAPFGGEFYMQGENPPQPGLITVGGSFPVPIAAQIYGPIDTPVIDVASLWAEQFNYSLVEGRVLNFNSFLWNRGVRLDDQTNLAGKVATTSPKPSACLIPPGQWSVILRGRSSTGTARCVLSWRQRFAGY